ncbi:MAG: DUF2845 domain-containing protein [Pseudomonas sp.]
MLNSPFARLWAAVLLTLTSVAVQASMRCDKGLIAEGDISVEVARKCGEPVKREIYSPTVTSKGGATVELWVYGPDRGMYRYLRFIDGELVQIRSGRE